MNMPRERVAIYIDGSNFYFKLRNLHLPSHAGIKFDFLGFAKLIAAGRRITNRNYYIGVVEEASDNPDVQKMYENQQALFAHLRSASQKFNVIQGYLLKSGGSMHEKGVDVRIAVDMLVGAFEDRYDTAIVVSSDTDLIPAIKWIKKQGKNVEYVGFVNEPSHALTRIATTAKLLNRNDIVPLTAEKLPLLEKEPINLKEKDITGS